ncbi:phosphatidylglycerophosphatase A family protein [Thiohalobacter sp.]|uniref:phosphatidylglycerophosphatase A family protein n=1 Tax=Thiohalobacter sp. TaxID=2025948 RepID=UPI0026218B0D|nr:phosphatidylglycerophosphatase A [Thiohalobacter sp.]
MAGPVPLRLLRDPGHLLAFGLGSGLAPVAPGTFGTLAALPLWWLLAQLPPAGYLLATLAAAVGGIWLCGRAARALGAHDHPGIVWDEVAGLLVTLAFVPPEWPWVVAGFLLFRLFDIVKPWPIRVLDQRVVGGIGIMADDLVAGALAAACLGLAQALPVP